MPDPKRPSRLSLSESRVARLAAEGLSDEQIAERLGITEPQVSTELGEVFRKLDLRSRTELALLAPEVPRSGAGHFAGDSDPGRATQG
jgi:DNA-binding CsgD family transcriptional regulator